MNDKPITMTEKRFFEWHEDDVSVTLRNKSGSYGGGSEVFVISERLEHCAGEISKELATNGSMKTSSF